MLAPVMKSWRRLSLSPVGHYIGDAVYPFTSKLAVSNSSSKPRVLAVEPWANDYTLLPGEELEIVAFGNAELPWFYVVEWDGTSQVYCHEAADFKVVQKGVELECGHGRSHTHSTAPPLPPRIRGKTARDRPRWSETRFALGYLSFDLVDD